MSSLMLHLENIFSIFSNVTDAFAGNYSNDNDEIVKMKRELEDHSIPTIGNDRRNLKEDSFNVVNDYRKAFEAKKEELSM